MIEEVPETASLLGQATIVVPTYNAARFWPCLHEAFERQGVTGDQVLVIDSSSTDETRKLVRESGYRLKTIPSETFRHGATRQLAVELLPGSEFLVFLTQDAIPSGDRALEHLLRAFLDPRVGGAYGRQLPRPEAQPIERHARLFNYSEHSEIRTLASREHLGIKAAFFSNSFSAYRRTALDEVGGFPLNHIICEDTTVAARMLLNGWKIAYQADAEAVHSHEFTMRQEFSRYFDIGIHHGRENWLLKEFGGASGEGLSFVLSQLRYVLKHRPSLLPSATLRNINKWCSYQLGKRERYLPRVVKESLSSQPQFWSDGSQPLTSPAASTPQTSVATRGGLPK